MMLNTSFFKKKIFILFALIYDPRDNSKNIPLWRQQILFCCIQWNWIRNWRNGLKDMHRQEEFSSWAEICCAQGNCSGCHKVAVSAVQSWHLRLELCVGNSHDLGAQCVPAVLPALSLSEEGSASHLLNRVSLILLQFRAGTSCEAWPMTHESSEDSPTDLHLAVNQGFNDSIFFLSFHVFNLLFLFSY